MLAENSFNIRKSLSKGWHIVVINKRGIQPSNHSLKLMIDYGNGYDDHLAYKLLRCANRSLIVAVYIKSTTKGLRLESSLTMPDSSFSIIRIPTPVVLFYGILYGLYVLTFDRGSKYSIESIRSIMRKYSSPERPKKVPIYGHINKGIYKNYKKWIATFETDGTNEAPKDGKIKFSIILPVFDPEPRLLGQAINSVKGQLYSNWELCISDDASTNPHIKALLQKEASCDSRIKVNYRDTNGHISKNSNDALALATGNYCVLLDHDDLLRPHSLSEVYQVIEDHAEAKFIYSDQDNIDEKGNRSCPHFKPQFNPDLFYGQNYLNHLTVLETQRLRELGGWRLGYEGSQDYDLYLRFLHGLSPQQIIHIPKVLYHWRAIKGSVASDIGEKSYAVAAGLKALQDYFAEHHPLVKVTMHESRPNYRIHWPLPEVLPKVSIIIPTKDNLQYLSKAVDSVLKKTSYHHYEIIIVDNNSSEEETLSYFDHIQKVDKKVEVIHFEHEFNYSAINNLAAKYCSGDLLCLMNNDIEIINSDWLSEMVSHAIRPDIGCVGAKLYYGDDTIQHAGVILGLGGYAAHYHRGASKDANGYYGRLKLVQNFSAVTAALLLVERQIFNEVGGLDEEYFKVAYNDVDFCLKVQQAGYRNLYTPYAEAYHYESKTRGLDRHCEQKQRRFDEEKEALYDRWRTLIDNDPAYSPNLTRSNTTW